MESGQKEPYHENVTKYCSNCQKNISEANFIMHEIHCQRTITLCSVCKEPVNKNDIDQHNDEVHVTVQCPHCLATVTKKDKNELHGPDSCPDCEKPFRKCMLMQHIEAVHSHATCPECNKVLKKADLHCHRSVECDKRPVECKYCGMSCSFVDSVEHEDYCGSRTEQCNSCGQYIMVRELEVHLSSKCQWPPLSKRDDHASKPAADERQGTVDPIDRLLTDFPARLNFHDILYRTRVYNTESEHEEEATHVDTSLPCEFCGRQLAPHALMTHQSLCKLTSTGLVGHSSYNAYDKLHQSGRDEKYYCPADETLTVPCNCQDDLVDEARFRGFVKTQLRFPEKKDIADRYGKPIGEVEFEDRYRKPVEEEYNYEDSHGEPVGKNDIEYSYGRPVEENYFEDSYRKPVVGEDDFEDSHGKPVGKNEIEYRYGRPIEEDAGRGVLIPCEFCLEEFDESSISQHQEFCFEEQTEELGKILSDPAERDHRESYRYPFAAMSMKQRENWDHS